MAKITFGIIVLNGSPFLEYNLRSLYPFAHQIIVVEGAVETAAVLAREDGHSLDGTLEMLYAFKAEHDPDEKLLIVTAEDAGYGKFWPEKDEMSQAYAKRTTGDWLWQVDSDEFYLKGDIQYVSDMLDENPDITTISFPFVEFFGGFESIQRGWWYDYINPWMHRVFKWEAGYHYSAHRPPTVVDEQGRDLRTLNWVDNRMMKRKGIYMYHYSYVFPKQAEFKVKYYSTAKWTAGFRDNQRWLQESYYELRRPFFIGEHQKRWQWLVPFQGKHPEAIEKILVDLKRGVLDEPMRDTQDIERLLANPLYRIAGVILLPILLVYWHMRAAVKPFTRWVRKLLERVK